MLKRSWKVRFLTVYFAVLFVWLGTTAMHIPDGYLSPITSFIMFLLVLPFWAIGVRRVRETMSARSVPLIALLAAFSFVIMMFNVPLPGGTTGHAVGATLAAIVLGPEVAVIAVSIALIIQAFFFGDGGILAIGANCFNMAVVIPYVAYAIYRYFSKNTPLTSSRRVIGAAIGGWVGVTMAAFLSPLCCNSCDGDSARARCLCGRGCVDGIGRSLFTAIEHRCVGSGRETIHCG
jgi:cobalamin biosynthesis protein CbiM